MLLNEQPYTADTLLHAAIQSGLNAQTWTHCFQNRTYKTKVSDDVRFAKTLGVKGTPSLYLNNRYIKWTTPKDLLDQLRRQTADPPSTPNTPKEPK